MLRNARLAIGLALFGALGFTTVLAATFDGTPSAPLPIGTGYTDPGDGMVFDVQVHSRDSSSWQALPAIQAEHGADCSAPPATHTNTSYEGSVYICKDHIMTAINGAAGYAEVVLTPNLLFDFSRGGSVTWDMSTEKDSSRDWWDLTISPWNQNLALPLLSSLSQGVDLNGTAMNAIHIGTDNGEGAPELTLVKNGNDSCALSSCAGWALTRFDAGIPACVNQAAVRQSFTLTVANGRMKFTRAARMDVVNLQPCMSPAVVYWDVAATASFNVGVVQFAQHSYTPTKDGAGVPATWHWDNLDAQPSTPFTILHAEERATSGGTIHFPSAPAGAYLRFSGICRVSVNGVTQARVPSALLGQGYHPEHFSSYSVAVPAGSTSASISFGPDDWYSGPCLGKDFTIWSLSSQPPAPTPSSTSTPTATAAIASATPTATNSPLPTATPSPSATPSPTPTSAPTSTPTMEVCRARRGTSIFGQVLYTGTIQNGVCVP